MRVQNVNAEALRVVVDAAKSHKAQCLALWKLHNCNSSDLSELNTAIWMMEKKIKEFDNDNENRK